MMSSRRAAAPFGGAGWAAAATTTEGRVLPAKVLVKVTIGSSLAPVQLLVAPEMTAGELIRRAVDAYCREGARPLLTTADPKAYEIHYSQFSLESLDPAEKVIDLGSRNFFLCLHRPAALI